VSIWDPKQTLDSVGLGRTEQKRATRVADVIRNELAVLMINKVRDPKLAEVNISRVEVTDDLKIARIFFTLLSGNKRAKAVEKSLLKARGFMRSHLAKTLNLKYTPELQFRYDDTADKVAHVESLFQEIENERKVRGEDT
jgi:ribosome-binding factor A